MKACIIERFGGVEELKIQDVPKPHPQTGELLIKVEYAAINPVDWKIREGYLSKRLPHEFPIILGWDAAGIVSVAGKNANGFREGDLVYAYCRKPVVKEGTFAEYVAVEARHVAKKPSNLTMAQASAIPLTALTAWQSLFDFAHIKEGDIVLIHAGAGGVGGMAIQLAKHARTTVITTASAKNHDYVKKLGADYVVDYTKEDFVEKVHKIAPKGVEMVYDCAGGDTARKSLELVKEGGVLASIAELIDESFGASKKVKTGFVFVAPNGHQLKLIAELIEKGVLTPPHIEEFSLEQVGEALEKNRLGHTRGKLVLKIN